MTPTYTVTSTFTDSPTRTATPTVTNTPVPFPYIVKVQVYNAAGEKIKLIGEMPISANLGRILTCVSGTASDTFDPNDAKLQIIMQGIQTVGGTTPDISLVWDGTNDGGQAISQGLYFVKFTVANEYGQVDTVIKEINVLTSQQYVRLKIYNSAGELVRTIYSPNPPGNNISLGVSDVVLVGKDNAAVQVEYAPGQIISWDGNNSDGRTVDSGVYEMKVEIATASGYQVVATKSVTVLNAGKAGVISGEKIFPNPVVFANGGTASATIQWAAAGQGRMTVTIYNMAGELVRKFDTSLVPSQLSWDMTTGSGQPVTSGLYVIVMQAKKNTGEIEIKVMKMSVLKKF